MEGSEVTERWQQNNTNTICQWPSDPKKVEVLSDHFVKSFNNSQPPLSPVDVQSIEVDSPNTCPEQLLCAEEEVLFLLTSLHVKKASGPDGISARMLNATAAAITPVVTKLFNVSISTIWPLSEGSKLVA